MTDYIDIVEEEFLFWRNGNVLFSGHPDRVRIFEKQRIVVCSDYKFGFKEVQPADGNFQLRCYLTMIAAEFPADAYYGLILQPRISAKPLVVEYSPADIVKARAEIERIYDACNAPDPPRRASNEACEWCEAKALCPEFKAWVGAVERAGRMPVAQWSDEEMDLFESRRGILEKYLKDTHEAIRAIKAANPERLPGWSLKPGNTVRSVTDLVQAWAALQPILEEGLGKEAAKMFSDCCSIALGDLEDLIWAMRKDTPKKISQKESKRLVNQLLSGLLEYRQNKPSLVKDE